MELLPWQENIEPSPPFVTRLLMMHTFLCISCRNQISTKLNWFLFFMFLSMCITPIPLFFSPSLLISSWLNRAFKSSQVSLDAISDWDLRCSLDLIPPSAEWNSFFSYIIKEQDLQVFQVFMQTMIELWTLQYVLLSAVWVLQLSTA